MSRIVKVKMESLGLDLARRDATLEGGDIYQQSNCVQKGSCRDDDMLEE